MNSFGPLGERIDMKDEALTGLLQIANESPFPVFSKDHQKVKGAEELRKRPIKRTSPNEKRGHASLIDRQNFIGIESLIDQFKNSRETHEDQLCFWEGISKGLNSGQGQDEIPQSSLVNHQDRSDFVSLHRCRRKRLLHLESVLRC